MATILANTAVDLFNTFAKNIDSPADIMYRITPNNSANVPYFTRGVYFGETGNVNIETVRNETNANITIPVTAYTQYPWRIRKVWQSNTTCNTIFGIY